MNIEPGFSREAVDMTELAEDEEKLRRKRRMIMIGAISALILVVAIMLYRGSKDTTTPPPSLPRVTVIQPTHGMVTNHISATGSLAARREMPVGIAGDGGMVSRVLVEPGDWVHAGQTLAIVERSVESQQAAQLSAEVAAARADAALAQSELDRAKKLVDRGFISKADVDRKTATRDASRAKVAVAQAQLGEIRARIGRLDIRSPSAGLVLTRAVEPGQIVSPGSGALFRVAKDGEMEMRAVVAETDLARLKHGLQAEVTPVGSKKSFAGSIWQLSPVIDPTTRQGIARISLSYNSELRPGGFASASIASGTISAPELPESAILNDEKGNYVYVIDAVGVVSRREVSTGDVSERGIVILSGLSGKEKVVLSAGAFLSPGEKVVPVRASTKR